MQIYTLQEIKKATVKFTFRDVIKKNTVENRNVSEYLLCQRCISNKYFDAEHFVIFVQLSFIFEAFIQTVR